MDRKNLPEVTWISYAMLILAIIMFSGVALIGAMVQYFGRIPGTAESNRRCFWWHIGINLTVGAIGMWIMCFYLSVFGYMG